MPLQIDYTDASTVQAYLNRDSSFSGGETTFVASLISATSRWIDGYCNLSFGSETATTHTFDAANDVISLSPSLRAATTLTVDGVAWASDQYYIPRVGMGGASDVGPFAMLILRPYNHVLDFQRAYYWTTYFFPNKRAVAITGDWGFASVPSEIKHAASILTARAFKARDSAFSDVIAMEGAGMKYSRSMPPDVAATLDKYRRWLL